KRRAMPAGRREALPPLPPRRRGSDQRYKQVYLTSFYDQAKGRRLVGVTRKDHRGLGALLRRDAARVRLPAADERVGLVDGAAGLRGAAKRAVADRLLSYAAERREMMPYEACEARGWDVGTGPMESMCGVTTDRVKGRGRRWDIANAEAMMALEALHQSNLW